MVSVSPSCGHPQGLWLRLSGALECWLSHLCFLFRDLLVSEASRVLLGHLGSR